MGARVGILREAGEPPAVVGAGPANEPDAETLETLLPRERELLDVLEAAETALPLDLLAEAGVADALRGLARRGLVQIDSDQVMPKPGIAGVIRGLPPAPRAGVWTMVARIGEQTIAAAPGDPGALVFACRALARHGEPRRSLDLLQRYSQARTAVSSDALARLLREIGAADALLGAECQVLLAREQLRRRDFEAARRTLEPLRADELAPPLSARVRVLRAEALLRCGDPGGAAIELEQAHCGATGMVRWQVELGLADVALLRGDFAGARSALHALRHPARDVPRVAARRAMTLGLSYLLEDRPHRALARARQARLAHRRCKDRSVDPLVLVVEIAALMALDRIDRATAVITQAAVAETEAGRAAAELSESLTPVFEGGVLYRRGEFADALRLQKEVYAALDKRSDRVLLAFAAHFTARCAMGSGLLEQAESHLRIASGIAGEPGFAVLRPMCELDFALLGELRGEREMAREHVARALSGSVQSPLARVERWALMHEERPVPRAGFEAGDAYAALRAAERALETGALQESETAAAGAEAWYRRVGAAYEVARARLARAEALARSRRLKEARAVLDSCVATAERNGYAMVAIGARLVEAFIADRAGEFAGYRSAIRAALERAAPELVDRSLLAAAARVGLPGKEATSGAQPWRARVDRLGLARPFGIVYERDDRRWLLAPGELPEDEADLVVALDTGEAVGRSGSVKLPLQRLQLLAAIARAGRPGLTLEALYSSVWGGTQYHPLRHRNAIYVGLNRLRESLSALVPRAELLEVCDGLCRLAPGIAVAVRDEAGKTK